MFESLENILKQITKSLQRLELLIQLLLPKLITKSAVAKFLNVSTEKINDYIETGEFKLNEHYIINEHNKIEFIPEALIEFKMNSINKIKIIKKKEKEKIVLSKVSSKILKGILWIKI